MNHRNRTRCYWIGAASLIFVFAHSASLAANMCNTDRAAPENLGVATRKASVKFIEASSHAFLAFKTFEEGSDTVSVHSQSATSLLEEAISGYKAALQLTADLAQADTFLKQRDFERLQRVLGITPGTLNHARWELITRTVQKSPTPAADLIRVCVAGAESLKSVMARLKPDISPVQVRRVAYNWHLVLMHGSLVSDAFDASIR